MHTLIVYRYTRIYVYIISFIITYNIKNVRKSVGQPTINITNNTHILLSYIRELIYQWKYLFYIKRIIYIYLYIKVITDDIHIVTHFKRHLSVLNRSIYRIFKRSWEWLCAVIYTDYLKYIQVHGSIITRVYFTHIYIIIYLKLTEKV